MICTSMSTTLRHHLLLHELVDQPNWMHHNHLHWRHFPKSLVPFDWHLPKLSSNLVQYFDPNLLTETIQFLEFIERNAN